MIIIKIKKKLSSLFSSNICNGVCFNTFTLYSNSLKLIERQLAEPHNCIYNSGLYRTIVFTTSSYSNRCPYDTDTLYQLNKN